MDSNLLNQVTQQLKPVSNASKIPVGHTKPANTELIEAVNQIFELFRFSYHNQFLKAYPEAGALNMAKRLWLNALNGYTYHNLMQAAESASKENQYLPTLAEIIRRCDTYLNEGMADAYQAYIEACRAPQPKRQFKWSHPAVYYAGRASDWFFLASNTEKTAFPVFKRNYEILLKRLQNGEDLTLEITKALPKETSVTVDKHQALANFAKLQAIFQS